MGNWWWGRFDLTLCHSLVWRNWHRAKFNIEAKTVNDIRWWEELSTARSKSTLKIIYTIHLSLQTNADFQSLHHTPAKQISETIADRHNKTRAITIRVGALSTLINSSAYHRRVRLKCNLNSSGRKSCKFLSNNLMSARFQHGRFSCPSSIVHTQATCQLVLQESSHGFKANHHGWTTPICFSFSSFFFPDDLIIWQDTVPLESCVG